MACISGKYDDFLLKNANTARYVDKTIEKSYDMQGKTKKKIRGLKQFQTTYKKL